MKKTDILKDIERMELGITAKGTPPFQKKIMEKKIEDLKRKFAAMEKAEKAQAEKDAQKKEPKLIFDEGEMLFLKEKVGRLEKGTSVKVDFSFYEGDKEVRIICCEGEFVQELKRVKPELLSRTKVEKETPAAKAPDKPTEKKPKKKSISRSRNAMGYLVEGEQYYLRTPFYANEATSDIDIENPRTTIKKGEHVLIHDSKRFFTHMIPSSAKERLVKASEWRLVKISEWDALKAMKAEYEQLKKEMEKANSEKEAAAKKMEKVQSNLKVARAETRVAKKELADSKKAVATPAPPKETPKADPTLASAASESDKKPAAAEPKEKEEKKPKGSCDIKRFNGEMPSGLRIVVEGMAEKWHDKEIHHKVQKIYFVKESGKVIVKIKRYDPLLRFLETAQEPEYYYVCLRSGKLSKTEAPAKGSYRLLGEKDLKIIYSSKRNWNKCTMYQEAVKACGDNCSSEEKKIYKVMYKTCGDLTQKQHLRQLMRDAHKEVKKTYDPRDDKYADHFRKTYAQMKKDALAQKEAA